MSTFGTFIVVVTGLVAICAGLLMHRSIGRLALPFIMIGLIIATSGLIGFMIRKSTDNIPAPVVYKLSMVLNEQSTPSLGKGAYKQVLFGSNDSPGVIERWYDDELKSLGFTKASNDSSITIGSTDKVIAQYNKSTLTYKLVELKLPTRFAGVDYSTNKNYDHLYTITLTHK